MNRIHRLIFTLAILVGGLPGAPNAGAQSSTPLYLNEIMASNGATIQDEDGDNPDWIEIYYDGEEPLSLELFGLTDDPDEPFQWFFPDTTIHPGEYMLIWASGKDRSTPGQPLHTNFSISVDGEDIMLSHPAEGLLDHFEARHIPTDISAGKVPDGYGDWALFEEPTPGGPNDTEPLDGMTNPVLFSREAGFYTSDFSLSLTPVDDNVTIYYTLDGSRPTRDSRVYTGPIDVYDRSPEPNVFSTIRTSYREFDWRQWYEPEGPVTKSTVVRVMAIRKNHLPAYSNKTYFVMDEGADRYVVPVIALATDSLNLFDHETGIYIPGIHYEGRGGTGNEFQTGREWEREAVIEFFNESGERKLHQNVSIRIHGGFSRQLAQKSLRLYARNEYGDNRFRYPFFREIQDSVFNRLILRNSGNTWGEDMFRDAAAQALVRHFNMDTQAYRPTVLFLNGEFWGIHNIRERYDKHYLGRVYDVDPENIDLLTRQDEAKEGDANHYHETIAYIDENDLSIDAAMTEVETMIDPDNLLDYYSAQVYFGNNDWPQNNIDFWRLRVPYDPDAPAGHDGRWRWMLFDVDKSLGHETGPEFDMIQWITQPEIWDNEWPNKMFRNLLENERFTKAFINRMADHLNTAFQPERVKHFVDSLQTPVSAVIGEHIHRWSLPESFSNWYGHVQEMYQFADERPEHQRRHIMDHFDIPDAHEIRFQVNNCDSGYLQVNSFNITDETPGISDDPCPWYGTYFEGIPITVTAIPQNDQDFLEWRIDGEMSGHTDSTITLDPTEELRVEAIFSGGAGTDPEETPSQIHLHQNYPNPFNASTVITFELPEHSEVMLDIYDIIGRKVTQLVNGIKNGGIHKVVWDAGAHSSGIYIVQLSVTPGFGEGSRVILTEKMTVLK